MNGFHYYYSKSSLSYDANKGVSWIDYDKLGNPIRVQFTDHSITEHGYAADGRRLKTIHRTSIPQSNPLGIGVTASLTPAQTQSIDSIDYVGSFIYEKGLNFNMGSAVKYRWRAGHKDGESKEKDLAKCDHYAILEAKKRKYEQIKSGMMHDLLTGRVRVKGE